MEIQMSNLPPDLDQWSLQGQLDPYMRKLGIKYFQCDKQSRKPFAWVVFPLKQDGLSFLSRYGEVVLDGSAQLQESPQNRGVVRPRGPSKQQDGRRPTKARFRLMNVAVFCRQSTRPPPEKFHLKSIQDTIDRKHSQQQQQHQNHQQRQQQRQQATTFSIKKLCCGYWDASSDHFSFVCAYELAKRGQVKLMRRNMTVQLEGSGLQLRIPLRSIFELVWSTDKVAVTLTGVPVFLAKADDLALSMSSLTIPSRRGRNGPQWEQLPALDAKHERVSSLCLVYCFVLGQNSDLDRSMADLRDRGDLFVTRSNFTFGASSVSCASVYENLRARLSQMDSRRQIPFDYLFLLQALVTNGFLHPSVVLDLAGRLEAKFAAAKRAGESRPPISVAAFKKLFSLIDYPSPSGENKLDVDSIVKLVEEAEGRIRAGTDPEAYMYADDELTATTTYVFKATVSPGRIVLTGPEREAMNRVLRKYPKHTDFFLRVQFVGDDHGADLRFSAKVSLERILKRFKTTLSNGIGIAGRVFRFLGGSHSALRSQSTWLAAPFIHEQQLIMPQTIIEGLGEFSKMRCPAKRAARIGQAFTEVPWAVAMEGIESAYIRDVERGGRVFSDGVGTISTGAIQAVWDALPASKGKPTCLQIRYAGAKGMLSLNPKLPGRQVLIRDSMVKFTSADTENLEICDVSKPTPLVLNRQLIKILEDMGAPSTWFLGLQEEKLVELRKVTRDVYNTTSYLTEKSVAKAVGLPKFFIRLAKMGLDFRREPLLRAIVEAVVLQELRLLKHKARIPVPLGVTLFGVLDEFKFLKANEVYVTYDPGVDGRFKRPPGEGPVIICRSPALHPGDIQIAHNVAVPAGHPLRLLSNCVVFSQRGDRDLPSKLAGGDLDGDMFHITWAPEILSSVTTHDPADYPRVAPLELDRPIELADMSEFFIEHAKHCQVGLIAVRHMILADQRELGTLDEDCKKLAELHSTAVDFSKTGRAPDLSSLPKMSRCRPDFLAPGPITVIGEDLDLVEEQEENGNDDDDDDGEGPQFQYYRSTKVLGQLYRAVDEKLIWAEEVRYRKPSDVLGRGFWDEFMTQAELRIQRFGYVKWTRFEEEAHRLRDTYEGAVAHTMRAFSEHPAHPLTELEVVVGFVGRKGYLTGRQRDRSVKLKDDFERISAWITRQMRRRAGEGQTGQAAADDQSVADSQPDTSTSDLDTLELCLACVHVGVQETTAAKAHWSRSNALSIRSFKVVAAAALLQELNTLERLHVRGDAGGGFVGVRGGAARLGSGVALF